MNPVVEEIKDRSEDIEIQIIADRMHWKFKEVEDLKFE